MFGIILSSACFTSYGGTIECVELLKNNTIEIELKKMMAMKTAYLYPVLQPTQILNS